MSPPTAEQQIRFLTNLQRLLAEGQFVATYKYALLLALADIAIESDDDSGGLLPIPTRLIAKKFVLYYWRQVVPYVPRTDATAGQVLQQNTGRQAAIIRRVLEARQRYGDSLVAAQRDKAAWNSLVRDVDQVVRQMPLWKLQTVGRSSFDFLYENHRKGTTIELRPGVAYCLRQFYGLIGDLVRGAWVRYIRRHALDLGHNFVLADPTCNSSKADHLAAADSLAAWVDRNQQYGKQLEAKFDEHGVLHDLPTSVRITNWAYQTTFDAGGLTWETKETMVPLPPDWQRPLIQLLDSSH